MMDLDPDKVLIKEIITEDRQLRAALTNAPPPEPSKPNTHQVSQTYQAHIKVEVQRAVERAKLNIHRAFTGEPCISRATWKEMEEEVEAEGAEAAAAAEVAAVAFAERKDEKEIPSWDRQSIRKCRTHVLRAKRQKAAILADPIAENRFEDAAPATIPVNPAATNSNTTATSGEIARLAARNQRYLALVRKMFKPDYVENKDENIDLWLSIHKIHSDPTVRVGQVENSQTPADSFDTVAHNATRDVPSAENPFASLFNCRRDIPMRFEVFDETRDMTFKVHDTLQEWLREEYNIVKEHGLDLRAVDIARQVLRSLTYMVGLDPHDAFPVLFLEPSDSEAAKNPPSNSRSNSFSNQSSLSLQNNSSASILSESSNAPSNGSSTSLSLSNSISDSPSDFIRPVVKRRTSSALFKLFAKSESQPIPAMAENGETDENILHDIGIGLKIRASNACLVRWITRCEENDW